MTLPYWEEKAREEFLNVFRKILSHYCYLYLFQELYEAEHILNIPIHVNGQIIFQLRCDRGHVENVASIRRIAKSQELTASFENSINGKEAGKHQAGQSPDIRNAWE